MKEETKELIAIAVSIAAHCIPCLKYHYAKARELGISDEDINTAIEVAHQVERGAQKAIAECQQSLISNSPPSQSPSCCGDGAKGGSSCC